MPSKHSLKYYLYYWIPPLTWAVCIYYMSSQSRIGVAHVYLYDFIIFKSLHMIEYAYLLFLLFRGFYSIKKWKQNTIPLLISSGITLFFSCSDEFHQLFTPTRQGQFTDIIIDGIGIVIMYISIKRYFKQVKILL